MGANVYHCAEFRQNPPNGFGDITIFWFSRWRPSAILHYLNFKYCNCSYVVWNGGPMCVTVPNSLSWHFYCSQYEI